MMGEWKEWPQEQDTENVRLEPHPSQGEQTASKASPQVPPLVMGGLPPARPSWPVPGGIGTDT